MFPIPTFYLKIAGAVIVLVALGLHFWSDHRIKVELQEAQVALTQTKERLRVSESNLIQATTDKKALEDAQKAAQEAQQKLENELKVTSDKLRKQKAQMPTKCEDVMKWAVEHSGDLKWEK